MLCLDDNLAAVGRRRELEVDALCGDLVDLDFFHALEHLHTALHLLGFGGLVAEAFDEGLDLRHLALLGRQLRHLAGATLLHLDDILAIRAFVVVDAAGGNLDGALGDIIQEGAVVRDEDHGAGIGGEVVLEPLYRDDVEVVGGLVEEEEVGVAQEQFGQLDAHLPAAAEDGHRAVEVAVLESQAQQHLLGLFLPTAAAKEGQVFGQLVVAFQKACIFCTLIVGAIGDFSGEAFLLSLEVVEGAESGESFLKDGTDGVGHHLLRQVTHGLARRHDEGAALRLLPAAENLQKGGFAGPIQTNKADPVVVGDVECYILKEFGTSKLNR